MRQINLSHLPCCKSMTRQVSTVVFLVQSLPKNPDNLEPNSSANLPIFKGKKQIPAAH